MFEFCIAIAAWLDLRVPYEAKILFMLFCAVALAMFAMWCVRNSENDKFERED